ncbi:uncharacterized protein LOC113312026 [Papaver somniferum]|uniref:uncharacterized protein LOC113312026 n=1 Tax=Papaver somniferum TaxID=3469 RepID=UPI000E6F92C2|nr:uncharacterized protein LOC113312026 [Papaver somniferum]
MWRFSPSVKFVKYLYKYVWKGVDCICMEVSSKKGFEYEIKQFVDARWIFPQEALWRIYKYQMNKISPLVVSLQIHLKDQQKILLPDGRTVRDVLQGEKASRTKLTEYLRKKQKMSLQEPFYTRNFQSIMGPTSFEYLLKIASITFLTYIEVAQHLGLLEIDTAMHDTLLEATQVQMPLSLRRLFCTMLTLWNPTGIRELWDEFLSHLIEDHLSSNKEQGDINLMLREPSSTLGPDLMKKYQLPTITEDVGTSGTNDLVMEEKLIPIPPEYLSAIGQLNRDLIRKTSLIIWDEATMANRYAFEALDRTLRDVTKVELPFGGKILVLGGDFRQLLPIIERGTRAQAVSTCLTNAKFWKHVNVIHLKENMHSRLDPGFSEFFLRIGDGVESYVIEKMAVRRLIEEVFPRLEENAFDKVYVSQRALITPKNDVVENLNQKVIEIFPGAEVVYHSFDTVTDDPKNLWTQDFLNTIAPGGLPPHKLILKIGDPIILLRNLDPKCGLCNGTRLLCRRLFTNLIDAEIVTGSCSGMRVLILRIPMEPPKESKLPFKLTRKQFPVHASFALTINKSQGKTIPHVGFYLQEHVFSHGQLYVALSRGVSRTTTKVLVKNGTLPDVIGMFTRNVVFKEGLKLCDSVW